MHRKISMLVIVVMLAASINWGGVASAENNGGSEMQIQLESLDRGLVAAATSEGIFLSWRLLANEVKGYSDSGLRGTDFYVYRDGSRIATVTDSTNYLDKEGDTSSAYYVSALLGGVEQEQSGSVQPWAQPHYDLPLQRPAPGVTPAGESYEYHANDMSVGDVDGDGQYEYIVKWEPTNSKDVSQRGYTGNTYIDTYKLDGTLLYRIDLGVNIRSGAHYTQFLVYDFDGDGKAEMMFKTAPGTKIISYANGQPAGERYITMPQEDIAEGFSHSDDYRLSAEDYFQHVVEMFMNWHAHEEVMAGNWPSTIEDSLGIADTHSFQYPLAREDAELLANYFFDTYAPSRSVNNRLREFEGFIVSGPEYLTVFNGETGAELQTVHYKPGRGDDGLLWGDYAMARIEPGNRVDRFLAGVAYLDGYKPSAVFARGYYTRTTLVAYDWDGNRLSERWYVDSGHAPMSNPFHDSPHGVDGTDPVFGKITTQGNHSLSTADVDGDGKQEIIYGAATIDHDGSLRYSSFATLPEGSADPGAYVRLGHGDAMHVADIDPDRPGLEIFSVFEGGPWAPYGYALRDAATGEVIYGGYTGRDTGRGMIGDIARGQRGLETWAVGLWSAGGDQLGTSMPGTNMNIKWSADMSTAIVNGSREDTPTIDDWERGRLLTATGTRTNNYTKGNPSLVADIFGDWREELLVRTADSSAIRIYLSTEVTDRKLHTLMHDIQYRTGIAWQNTTYNQPAYPSFYFASDIDWSKVTVPNAGPLPYVGDEQPNEPDPPPSWRFDFGSATSPVAQGYIRIANNSVYDESVGYGLSKAVDQRDRGTPDDLRRDFVIGSGYSFMVDVPDGDYFLRIIAGDQIAFNRSGFTVEGVDAGSITSPAGQFAELTVMTTVSDGQLNIDIRDNGRINALEIISMSSIDSLTTEEIVLTPDAAVGLKWTRSGAAASYHVYRQIDGEAGFVLIGSTNEPAYRDETAELGLSYVYHVTLVTVEGIESSPSNEVKADLWNGELSAQAVPVGLSIAGTEDNAVKLAWGESEGALAYYVYRSRHEDGPYVRIGSSETASYLDESVSLHSDYYYRVGAVGEGGISALGEPLHSPAVQPLIRQMEKLDRSVVAIETENGVYVGWRMLGTDPESVRFNVYRNGVKVNNEPIVSSTNYLDLEGTAESEYEVKVIGGSGALSTGKVPVWSKQYWSIPLDKPADGVTPDGNAYTYVANEASVGDVDGDGVYEIILKWEPSNAQDNSRSGYTGNVFVDAYKLDGTRLWRIDAGRNIRAGAHYTQLMVYDLDGDGKAEIAFKTADGTIDGEGTVIGDADADWRNSAGYILDGPEYLTVFEGATGKALHTVDYHPPRGNVSSWGDGYGNRVDRFLAAVAYLDGQKPSLVMARGYYTRTVLAAYAFTDGELKQQWVFDSNDSGNGSYAGQGNHNLSVADVDGDGFDEIIYGASVIDHDGTGLYTTGWGHGDAIHVSNLNPNRQGLEVYQPHESSSSPYGFSLRDAETGEILWGVRTGSDVGRGLAADIDPRYEGAEIWASNSWNGVTGRSNLYSVEGEVISENSPKSINHAVWWDGDLLRELLDHDFDPDADPHGYGKIEKWNWETSTLEEIYRPEGTRTSNHTKGNPVLQADLFGDWREEVIWASSDSTELQIHTTVDVTEHRIYTLMHDPVYRLGVAWQNVAYNQPPHTGFFLGEGMDPAPKPMISTGDRAAVELDILLQMLQEAKAIANADNRYTADSYEALLAAISRIQSNLETLATPAALESALDDINGAIQGLKLWNTGGTPGSGWIGPIVGEADNEILKVDTLSYDAQGVAVIHLKPETKEILLPSDPGQYSEENDVLVTGAGLSLKMPGRVFLQLLERVSSGNLEGGATIRLILQKLEASEAEELAQRAVGAGQTVVVTAGDVYRLELALAQNGVAVTKLDRFDVPIALSLRLPDSAEGDISGLFHFAENGEIVYAGGVLSDGWLTADIRHFSDYGILQIQRSFEDVAPTFWGYPAIRALSAKGIASGTGGNRFAPDREVTRAEFAALLVRSLRLDMNVQSTFRDVSPVSWYAKEVAVAHQAGIIQGYGDGLFRPDAPISREQMAVMMLRAYGLASDEDRLPETEKTAFKDNSSISPWAEEAVRRLHAVGWIEGRGGNRYAPQESLTRAESIQVLYRMIAHLEGRH
ncbi:rhamnogalacturonan lyase family protein [Paenibacillus sp. CAU 1782]